LCIIDAGAELFHGHVAGYTPLRELKRQTGGASGTVSRLFAPFSNVSDSARAVSKIVVRLKNIDRYSTRKQTERYIEILQREAPKKKKTPTTILFVFI